MKHQLLCVLRGVVFLALLVAIVMGLSSLVAHVHAGPAHSVGEPGPVRLLIGEMLQVLGVVGATALIALWRDPAELRMAWGRRFLIYAHLMDRRWVIRFGQGLGAGVLSAVVLIGIIALCGGFSMTLPDAGMGRRAAVLGLYALVFLLVGVFEETALRGYLLRVLSTAFGFPAAAILTSALFGAVHLLGGTPVIGALQAGLAGVALAAMFYRTGSLWFPIGWHAAWDWMQSGVFGVADSGHVLPGALLLTVLHGPAWLSGGADGPEGSVLCMVMMVAITLVCLLVPRKATAGTARFSP